PCDVRKRDLRCHFGRIDPEDEAGGAMQPDMAEVAGLKDAVLVVEEQADAVSRVIEFGRDLLVRDKPDIGIAGAEQRYQALGHRTGYLALVLFPELHRIGKPAERVAEGADRELDQYRPSVG